MATKLHLTHEWNVPIEIAHNHLFDDELSDRIDSALKSAKRRMVSKEETDATIKQAFEVKANPDDVPGAVKKALPREAFQWIEESVWDKANKRFDWKIITSVMTDKIDCSGIVYYEKMGDNKTRRVVEGQISIKIPLVGKIAEKVIIGKVEESFRDTGKAEGEYFTEKAAG